MGLFGTDGVRGPAGEGLLTVEGCLTLGAVAAEIWLGAGVRRVAVARDTRRSGGMLGSAIIAGLTRGGLGVEDLGVLPTPALSWWVGRHSAIGGAIMVTASHNPATDNGIKLLGPDGGKIADAAQDLIEGRLLAAGTNLPPASDGPGGLDDVGARARFLWMEDLAVAGSPLAGRSIMTDAAMGAGWSCLEEAIARAGGTALSLGEEPNGLNINEGCGAAHPEKLAALVALKNAWAGVAIDGDGDRVVLIDEKGQVHDGDSILGFLAATWAAEGRLRGGGVVGTVATNGGLERRLRELGLQLWRTPVGDRHVAAELRARGANLGGEGSGHILTPDLCPTGDGIRIAVLTLAQIARGGRSVSEALGCTPRFCTEHRAVISPRKPPIEGLSPLVAAIRRGEGALAELGGRILVRYSGTEPVLRIQVEGASEPVVRAVADDLGIVAAAELGG